MREKLMGCREIFLKAGFSQETFQYAVLLMFAFVKTVEIAKLKQEDVRLDFHIMGHVLSRVEFDLKRMVKHHDINIADCHKIGACLTYWVCKLRPISVKSDGAYKGKPKTAQLLNELTAILTAIAIINAAIKKRRPTADYAPNREVDLWQMRVMLNAFLYNLAHCNQVADSLAILYYYVDITAGNAGYLKYLKSDLLEIS